MITDIGDLLPLVAGMGGLVLVGTMLRRRGRQRIGRTRGEETQRLIDEYLRVEFEEPAGDLAQLVHRSRSLGLNARLHVAGPLIPLPQAVELAAYRIVQEAVTNVIKHGNGQVSVVLDYRPDRFALTVDNPVDGRLVEARGPRPGLSEMRRRVTRLGGSFSAGPYRQGWRVHAELPIDRVAWETV